MLYAQNGYMNRIVLIGNGFDIAHGLKTKYEDFIIWYWEQCGIRLSECQSERYEDELCSFELLGDHRFLGWNWVADTYMKKLLNPNQFDGYCFIQWARKLRYCVIEYKSELFKRISQSVESKKWVDIENIYYEILVREKSFGDRYKILNNQLDFLRGKLIEYLLEIEKSDFTLIESIKEKIFRPIKKCEVSVRYRYKTEDFFTLSNIMLLNFNYTSTPEIYLDGEATINYIHGKLDNPQSVIFGYGDELDENYKRLKEQNDSECMRHVKSIRYLEHDNYRRMLEFIESDSFQVVIMGHSCGNSDRTLLNTIFEHPNCVSIKPYYYQIDNKTDNYSELTISINRNFNDPKLMRDRVVCKDYCEPLTNANNKPCTQPK